MNHTLETKTILNDAAPLFILARQGIPEVVVSGLSYIKIEEEEARGSDPQVLVTARSLLKPWQFLAADVIGDEAFWALGLASHSGQTHHLIQLARFSEKTAASEEDLFCPREYPLDANSQALMRREGKMPSRLMHPCSGKHLLSLAACRKHGYSRDGYWDFDHPLQKKLMIMLGKEINEKPIWLTDSCGLPTIAMTARTHLLLWERLARSLEPKVIKLKELWIQNIRLVGGHGRLESDLMEVLPGRILAKEGADGLLVVASLPAIGEKEPVAVCFVKLASGYHSTHLALALWALLSREKELTPTFLAIKDYLCSRLERWVPKDQELRLF